MKSLDAEVEIWRLPKVKKKVGLGTSQIYAMAKSGAFPKQVRISSKSVGWISSEIDAFIAARRAERDAELIAS